MSLALTLVLLSSPLAAGDLAIKEGPYLQWVTQSEITVMWETTSASDSTVFYRTDGGWQEASAAAEVKIHEIRLAGFQPHEIVDYYVRSREGSGEVQNEVQSDVFSFQTAPPGAIPFSFTVWGDNQGNPGVFGGLVNRMTTHSPALAISVGDVVDTGSVYLQWGQQLLTPLLPLAQFVPFFVAIGNHEQDSHWFYDYMAQPGNEHWFSFDYAGCHFVIVDTNYPFGPGSEQYEWLRQDLFSDTAQNAKWLFAFHHHPPYSEIYEESIYARARMHLVPLFEAAGVDIDFSGHIHDYERGVFVPPDTGRRIAYVQTSGGGGRLWEDEFDGEWDQIERVIQYVYHYCLVEIDGDNLSLRAIDRNGRVIDSFVLDAKPRDGEPPDPPPDPQGGEAITQWDFTQGDLRSSFGPGAMEYSDGENGQTAARVEFGSTASFGIASVGGEVAQVMKFPKATTSAMGYRIEHKGPPNEGGTYVNEYTMVFDLYLPAASFAADSWLGLYNTNASNGNDAEAFINLQNRGLGISGQYEGEVRPNTWHRVALVAEIQGGRPVLRKYIDGVQVGAQSLDSLDGRWSLYSVFDGTPWFFFLTDNNGDATSGYISSFLFVDAPLSREDVAALGEADADGILDEPCVGEECETRFVRGDANSDGDVEISDSIYILLHLFAGTVEPPGCMKTADTNDSGGVDLADAVYLLNFLFGGGPGVPEPALKCGEDPTEDGLGCEAFAVCP